jgi:hypothetical protein
LGFRRTREFGAGEHEPALKFHDGKKDLVLAQAAHIFEGLSTFGQMDMHTIVIRLGLMAVGLVLIYLSAKDILDPMVLMPMGLAMVLVNGATLTIEGRLANLFVDPMLAEPEKVVNSMQIFFLQPIYNLMFSNGLIACLVFMGIGVITPLDYLIASPLTSLLIAVGAELGSILTFPLAVAFGFNYREAASIARRRPDGALYLVGAGEKIFRSDLRRRLRVPEHHLCSLSLYDQTLDPQETAGDHDGPPRHS